jgi:hypothetical protein
MDKIYVRKIGLTHDWKLNISRPAVEIYEYEGEVDGEFGYCQGVCGWWRWVHLSSGIYSQISYRTKRGCKSAITQTSHNILYGSKGIYLSRRGKQYIRQFRDLVTQRDPDYFSRLGIDVASEQKSNEYEYWYQRM